MNTKRIWKNSLTVKTLIYLVAFSVTILLVLWIFQYGFLKVFYQKYQVSSIKKTAETILDYDDYNDLQEELETLAYDSDICIEWYSSGEMYYYNVMNKDCILENKNATIINAKTSLLQSSDEKTLLTVEDPRYDTKSVIYGIRLDNSNYIFLNTKLEDVNSTTYLLRNQLIYITLIVILLAVIVSVFVSKMLNRPILKITEKAKKMAEGNFEPDNEVYNLAEIDELNNVLNYARSEIRNTDELRRDLMANVSHDLKTPLTMIKAYAEMARDINANNEQKRADNLSIIIDEADRLNILVNDILDMSKLQNGNNKLDIENYDLIKELNNILKRYEIIKETENYKFILDIPDTAIVKADKKRINQVLYNLINNAINYTGKDLIVKINVIDNKKDYLIEIIDTGKGIDKDKINLIWSKYYKNEKNHQRNVIGTGLGLSIVQSIFNDHHFKYGVDSKKGKGTKFYFYIEKGKIS